MFLGAFHKVSMVLQENYPHNDNIVKAHLQLQLTQ